MGAAAALERAALRSALREAVPDEVQAGSAGAPARVPRAMRAAVRRDRRGDRCTHAQHGAAARDAAAERRRDRRATASRSTSAARSAREDGGDRISDVRTRKHGYLQRDNLRRFQLVRTVPAGDDGPDIDVVVDFLMPRDAEITRNTPPLISQFAVQRADGADLALRFYQMVAIEGHMPDGDRNRVSIAVASIPALLAMKGYAIANRLKRKDAYDIYYSVRNFPDGIDALVEATRPLLDVESALQGYSLISDKFRHVDDFGPSSVRRFVEGSHLLGDRTADQWQQDAFGQVDAWLRGLGLRQA